MQTVVENESSIEVCLVLSHANLQRNVTIAVVTQPLTATGLFKITNNSQLYDC